MLEGRTEITLALAKKPPSVTQIRKVITGTDPEDWDGDVWGDSDENSSEEGDELEERDVRPLIKAERHTGPHGGNPRTVTEKAGQRNSLRLGFGVLESRHPLLQRWVHGASLHLLCTPLPTTSRNVYYSSHTHSYYHLHSVHPLVTRVRVISFS